MGIHDNHRQRIYERFLREGLDGFEEHTVMEFLLFLTRPRGDTNPLAHDLINRFGSISKVLDAPIEELERVPGVGHTSAVILKFIPQMCAYYLRDKRNPKNLLIDSMDRLADFFMPHFMSRTQEALYIATVNDSRRLIHCTCLMEGTCNAVSVPKSLIIREATYPGVSGAFLAHNHPYGLAVPSEEDLAFTEEIQHVLALVNVKLLDHLVFSPDGYMSIFGKGMMEPEH